jgi:Ca2+-binding EF-hand superfamily protein
LQHYDLNENDLRTLLALADENDNGKITWKDFIPHGINAIQNFLERNKLSSKKKDEDKVSMKPDLLKVLYDSEIKKTSTILLKRFEAFDTDKETKKHSGLISFAEMQVCLRSMSHLTPKEINALLREYSMKQGTDQINYTNFASDLYRIRFELMDSRIMDINLKIID